MEEREPDLCEVNLDKFLATLARIFAAQHNPPAVQAALPCWARALRNGPR